MAVCTPRTLGCGRHHGGAEEQARRIRNGVEAVGVLEFADDLMGVQRLVGVVLDGGEHVLPVVAEMPVQLESVARGEPADGSPARGSAGWEGPPAPCGL